MGARRPLAASNRIWWIAAAPRLALATELTRIIRSPDVRSRLTAQGAEVYTMSPPEFTQFFEKERSMWAVLVKQSGVKFD